MYFLLGKSGLFSLIRNDVEGVLIMICSFIQKYKVFLPILIVILLAGFVSLTSHKKVNEESIVEEFNRNYPLFYDVEYYALAADGDLAIYKNGNEIEGYYGKKKNQDGYKLIDKQVECILTSLNYESIEEINNSKFARVVVFRKVTTRNDLEQGIVYLHYDDGKYGMRMEKIIDNWYYYSISYN
jgi:hypothetical protein